MIEDEKSLISDLCEKMQGEDFDILQADNGVRGLELALERKPDVIILDIIMPETDGVAMLSELRKDTWGKDVPVVVLTDSAGIEEGSKNTKSKIFDYSVKLETSLQELVLNIKDVLKVKEKFLN